jgi:hypothetical protein
LIEVCFLINVLTIKNTINEKKEKILNIVQLMQRILIIEVSDTTGADSSNAAKYKIKSLTKRETLKKLFPTNLNDLPKSGSGMLRLCHCCFFLRCSRCSFF